MNLQILIALLPSLAVFLVLFILPALLASLALLKRIDLANFQLWSLFLISWLVPIIGPITSLIATNYVLPKR